MLSVLDVSVCINTAVGGKELPGLALIVDVSWAGDRNTVPL